MAKTDPLPMRMDSFLLEISGWPDSHAGKYIKLIAYYYCNGDIPRSIMSVVPGPVRDKFSENKDGTFYHPKVKAKIKSMKIVDLSPEDQDSLSNITEIAHALGIPLATSVKGRKAFAARIREGIHELAFIAALNAIAEDEYHISQKFKHVTLEFLCRDDKLNKWAAANKGKSIKSEPKRRDEKRL